MSHESESSVVEVVETDMVFTTVQLGRACHVDAAALEELVSQGILEPQGTGPEDWRFAGANLQRAKTALRLIRDLGVNAAGAALALELMAQMEALRRAAKSSE